MDSVLFLFFSSRFEQNCAGASNEGSSASSSERALQAAFQMLHEVLAPYPHIRIALADERPQTRTFLRGQSEWERDLAARYVGDTVDLYPDALERAEATRLDRILRFVDHHKVEHWLALDDTWKWPERYQRFQVGVPHGWPIVEPEVVEKLVNRLRSMPATPNRFND